MVRVQREGSEEGEADGTGGQVRSVLKALALLEALAAAARGGLTLSELSRRYELHPSTTHRLLHTLIGAGYVRQNSDRRYEAGAGMARLGGGPRHADADDGLLTAAASVMQRLSEQVGERVSLSRLHGDEITLIAQTDGGSGPQPPTGSRRPAYCTAAGKALLAALDSDVLQLHLPRIQFIARTPNTITDSEEFLLELDRVRRRGYAANDEELQPGVRCVAAVIRGPRGGGDAALAISGATARVNVHHLADLALIVQQSATLISRQWSSDISPDEN